MNKTEIATACTSQVAHAPHGAKLVQNEELSLHNMSRSPVRLFTDGDSTAMAMVYLTDGDSRRRSPAAEERARRLVACWNALIGVSTEDVEAMAAAAKTKRESLEADEALLAGASTAAPSLN